MADQENELVHPQETEIDPESLKLLAMLHLNPTAAAHSPPLRASRKRRSPSNSSSSSKVQKKLLSKRTPLFPPSAVEIQEPPLLRRTFSEPIKNTTESPKIPEVFNGQVFSSFTCSLPGGSSALSSPENTKNGGLLSKSSPLPPPHLRRTSSAPITTTMMARPASRSPNPDKESSKGQRMERMKEIVQELAQVMEEGDEEEDSLEIECNNNKNDVEENENDEEAVWVDENEGGEGLVVHFKCQCGKIYDVLFSGNNCYYRLI